MNSLSRTCRSLLAVAILSRAAHGQSALSVHDAVQKALQGPALQVADAHVDEARGRLRQAGLGLNPRLFLQSEDLRPWVDNFSFPDQTEDYAYLSQTFELDGKRSKRVALGNARLKQAEAERDLRMREIAGLVSSAYWNAVSLQRVSDLLTNDDLKAVDDMVRYHRERVDSGCDAWCGPPAHADRAGPPGHFAAVCKARGSAGQA